VDLLCWGAVSHLPNPQAWGQPILSCVQLLFKHTHSYLPYLKAVSSICNHRAYYAQWQWPTLHRSVCSSTCSCSCFQSPEPEFSQDPCKERKLDSSMILKVFSKVKSIHLCVLKANVLEPPHLMHKCNVSWAGWGQPETLGAPWCCDAHESEVYVTGMARNVCSTKPNPELYPNFRKDFMPQPGNDLSYTFV
jgi:hypothetical protein